MPTTVRPAAVADVPAVTALLAAQLAEHAIATPRDALARAVAQLAGAPRRGRLLVGVVDGRVVGVAALSFVSSLEHGGRGAWLEELYVTPAERGRGVGSALLDAACAAAADGGAAAVDLEVDAGHRRAEHLYARAGFAPLPRTRWVRRLTAPPADAVAAAPADFAGGCFCGAVRWHVAAPATDVGHCHCTICRRTSGAPFVTWVTVPAAAFAFTRGRPAELRSTPRAWRTFCPACGTPLTFRSLDEPGTLDVTVASADDPAALRPVAHVWAAHELPWARLDDDLPRHPGSGR
jgi:GNAT superfamily N-acetyltransferase